MIAKVKEKELAIRFRMKGKTYSEILSKVPVTKSTLSIWLRSVGLARAQKQRLTVKRRAAQLRGGARRKEMRIEKSAYILKMYANEIGNLSSRELKLIGAALYWAEGTKEKEHSPSSRLQFANSDPHMVIVYMRWLRDVIKVRNSEIVLTLYLHENHKHETQNFEKFWLQVTRLKQSNLRNPVYKKHNPRTSRRNTGSTYRGLVAITVRQSTDLNRRVQGWICGIIGAHIN